MDLLTPGERRRAYLLLGMVFLMASLDVLGVASIMPFMAVLANPELVETNEILRVLYNSLGFTDPHAFLFFLGLVVFIFFVTSLVFKALTTWMMLRFTHMREYAIGRKLVAAYLHQPYEWFLNRHSAELGKNVLSEVEKMVFGALNPLMTLIAQGAVIVALLLLLAVVNVELALYLGFGLGATYGAIYAVLRKRLARLGAERFEANKIRFATLNEAFGGIKEVKIGGLEQTFIARYDGPARRFASHQSAVQIAAQLPRFALETVAFGGMLVVVLFLMRSPGGLQAAIPIIALYAFAGYRLMPALQAAYSCVAQLRFARSALDRLHAEVIGLHQVPTPSPISGRVKFEREISLDCVTYRYPNTARPVLENLNLVIPARATVGIVGSTGSGKTTMLDIILGLLQPEAGALRVDGSAVTDENRSAWQRSLGYVPQHIYLSDDSIAANIAFGVARENIDSVAVEKAARIANLHDFVSNELSQGYATCVGERGVRLSGGQRQRIGIARALYHQPQVLLLDEATSALDNITEQAVMDAVHNIGRKFTTILIAHRLSTVRECDLIYLLDRGNVIARGTFDELAEKSDQFRLMART